MRFRVCQEFTLTHVTTSPYSFSHEHCPCPLFKPFPSPSHDDLKLPKKPQLFITNCRFLQLVILRRSSYSSSYFVPQSPLRIFFSSRLFAYGVPAALFQTRGTAFFFARLLHTASAALFHTRGTFFDINTFRGRIAARNPFFSRQPLFFPCDSPPLFCGNSPRPGRMK